jgi:hypothetical protein
VTNLTLAQQQLIEAALKQFASAAQELSNILDETGYQLSNSAPSYMQDFDDFTYEVTSFVEDEVCELSVVNLKE